jgi:lipopolysaccharide/colanic/teichoic acid biosynthesis glycosyltransferase
MQRTFDVFFSVMAFAILSPIFLVIGIILRLTGEHEVLYVQNRVGLGGKDFGVFKFATMLKNSPNIGTGYLTTKGDPRVLPFGKFLRRTKLNELPQLFNILRGEMSFVGPRPQVRRHFELYTEAVQSKLNTVRPGLTGVGSVVFRDEEEILEKNRHMKYDDFYSLRVMVEPDEQRVHDLLITRPVKLTIAWTHRDAELGTGAGALPRTRPGPTSSNRETVPKRRHHQVGSIL